MQDSMVCKVCGSVLSAVTFTCVRGQFCKPVDPLNPGYGKSQRLLDIEATLSNGTKVKKVPQPNGGSLLVIVPVDRPMTDAEWNEYCAITAKSNAKLIAKMKTERIAKNRASFAASKVSA